MKIAVIGHFGFGKNLLNGQTIKTQILTEELERQLGMNNVVKIDTHGNKNQIIKIMLKIIVATLVYDNIIILPAQNGVRYFAPLLSFLKRISNVGLHYSVIGGWLPSFISDKRILCNALKRFDNIYVETRSMKERLEEMGFSNVIVMPNAKKLQQLSEDDLVYFNSNPLKICTFSRVMHEKGIEDAINVVERINSEAKNAVFLLDIYGQIDKDYFQRFSKLQESFPSEIKYRGCVNYHESVETIKSYFMLLFPTRFYTEGIPGTIIDAYCAGVPVLSARWENCSDIINDSTGITYDLGNVEQLYLTLKTCATRIQKINLMKTTCLAKSKDYLPENVISVLLNRLL